MRLSRPKHPGARIGRQPPGDRVKRERALIQNFDFNVAGKTEQFCASLAEDGTRRVFISYADTAKTLVILDASGLLGALKAELEEPDQLIAQKPTTLLGQLKQTLGAEADSNVSPTTYKTSPACGLTLQEGPKVAKYHGNCDANTHVVGPSAREMRHPARGD